MATKEQPKEMTRRQFLTTVGKVGGSVAVFSLMGTMGLLTPETLKAAEYTPPGKNDLNLLAAAARRLLFSAQESRV